MIDIDRLLRAIHRQETQRAYGLRVEPGYMPKGHVFWMQGRRYVGTGTALTKVASARWDAHGVWSAMSYGPYQILYQTAADLGYDGEPCNLMDPVTCHRWARRFIERQLARGASTVRQLADAYNTGNYFDAIHNVEYERNVEAFYEQNV